MEDDIVPVEDHEKLWEKFSIYKIPHYMKIDDPSGMSFNPQLVSIGPYHFGERHLMPMEKHKQRAYSYFLRKSGRPEEDYMEPLRAILPVLMDSYPELDGHWQQNTDEFLKLLVLDGCFLIQILRKEFTDYGLSDPVFSSQRQATTFIEQIKRDMLLMENQLPMTVIQNLAALFTAATGISIDIKQLVLNLFFPSEGATCEGTGAHILELVHLSIIETEMLLQNESQSDQQVISIPSVGENEVMKRVINNRSVMVLNQGGIKFRRNANHNRKGIAFNNGNLHLPSIVIDENSESMFLNIIAMEQLHFRDIRPISSYFLFLSGLIASVEDVRLLRDKEIIKSSIPRDDTIYEIFTKLSKGLVFKKDDKFNLLQEELNHYYLASKYKCQTRVDRWYLKLRKTYFDSPWSIIGVVTTTVVVVFTVMGACYSMLSYRKA